MPDNSPTDDAQPAISGALTSAHTGLRGLVAIYILVFHAVIFSLGWNLQGSALMPVFFLLSGYSLALGYGAGETLPLGRFFRNRVARIAPVYYVCMVVAIPPALASQSWVPPGLTWWVLATNTPMVQMWSGLPPLSFAGPAWTVSTLFFFYLCFPLVLRFHRRHSYGQLRRWLLGLFVAQAVIFFGISFGLGGSDPEWGFWASHAWPVSRLAVFDMGVVAGLMVLKRADAEMGGERFMGTAAADRSAWARRTDRRAAVFAVLILGLSTAAVLGATLWAPGGSRVSFPT